MKSVVIYHNPGCGTSRNTLTLIRNAGIEPEVIEYLHNPPARARLLELIAAAGLTVRQVLREKNAPPYEEPKLSDPALTDAQLLDAMMLHPILINRPLVVTDKGVRLCRPAERVLEILPEA
jgi:arsenate reductase